MRESIAICSYDGTSRVPGTCLGAELLWDCFSHDERVNGYDVHAVRLESKNSAMFCRQLRRLADHEQVRFALGGEHLITFPLVEALQHRLPKLKLVVLDAHHDAYEYPLLTHHSVFYYTAQDLRMPTLVVGTRYDVELGRGHCSMLTNEKTDHWSIDQILQAISAFVGDDPFYLSVDLDVLNPEVFPAVSSPVPGGVSLEDTTRMVSRILQMDPVAADINEYNPLRDDANLSSLRRLEPILEVFKEWLST